MKTLLALCAVCTTAIPMAGSPLNAQSLHRDAGRPPGSVDVADRRVGGVSGRVVDSATSRPLQNVQISVVGTRFGAATRDDGTYTIGGVPAGTYTIRAAFIGRAPQTRTIAVADGQTQRVDFSLTTQAVQLETVVSTGYLTQSTRTVTGSVANVNMANVQT